MSTDYEFKRDSEHFSWPNLRHKEIACVIFKALIELEEVDDLTVVTGALNVIEIQDAPTIVTRLEQNEMMAELETSNLHLTWEKVRKRCYAE